jgi:phosphoribosyl 1,2-cyclic phosphate phosphodiesterase
MSLTLTILGCGSSAGVPRPALGWGACDPNNPKNRRRRCSLLAERKSEQGITRVVIDTAPDLREQLIDAQVDHIDAVFLTHEHADQTHGIDDLRSVVLHQRRRIPVYLNQSTADQILLRFSYCFVSPEGSDYPPILTHHAIEAGESRVIEGKGGPLTLTAFLLQHGNIPALGYRIADAAYTPDVSDIPKESWPALENLEHRRAALYRTPQPLQRQ